MTLQRFLSPVAQHVKNLLAENTDLGFKAVFYGDQELIPKTPAAAVSPANITRDLRGVPFQIQTDFALFIIVYGGQLGDQQGNTLEIDRLTEATSLVIDRDGLPPQHGGTRFNDMIIHGNVLTIDYGYAIRSNKLVRANRITWTGLTKTGLTDEVSP